MPALGLVDRLLGTVRDRDGRAAALQPPATPPGAPTPGAPSPARPPSSRAILRDATATKLLGAWLANRHQTLVPHTLNFRVLAPEQAALLIALMAAAVQADGRVDPVEERHMEQALARVGAGPEAIGTLRAALGQPQPLSRLLGEVQQAGLAAHAYAAVLLALDRRSRVNRAFLDYLAARLALPAGVAAGLERRYRA
ncbi:MAG: DUF533 domain-containing protein [Dongiaceae bacterium]